MNREELRLAAQKRIADTSGIRTTPAEVNRLVDDAYLDIAERTGVVVRTANLACLADQHFVTLPDDCLYPILLRDLATGEAVDWVDWTYIDRQMDAYFIRRTGTFPEVAAPWGLGELLIHPAYSSAGTLELTMAVVPGPLADSDEPAIPEQHHIGLAHYVHARAVLKDAHGDVAGPRIGRSRRQMATYMAMAGALGKWAFDRQGAVRRILGSQPLRSRTTESTTGGWEAEF